ncbi:MAG: flavodoxin family protein, partial [Candidatus Dojkabacteria bacterium]|nr:flavodoxin family protein [Candidatus Dojkabacteria bacterium]
MKTLIIYDSLYGNTKEIAEVIYKGITYSNKKILPVERTTTSDLEGIELLIVGSPTHGGQPKPTTGDFLKRIPNESLKGVKVSAFDTRMPIEKQSWALRMLMRVIGFAAP